ncbi:MAG: cytidine deaminase [Lachnospiraceae bacterium]|nr:cytidine deaminase [Lachnospiraceae bacterium]
MIWDAKTQNMLVAAALEARSAAYAPYSGYAVGAALLTINDKLYTGCNIENASYGATNCAERTAFYKAVCEGEKEFCAIAIAGGIVGQAPADYAYPCGVCRQVMQEFCEKDFKIIVAKGINDFKIYTLEELLPYSFQGESIR